MTLQRQACIQRCTRESDITVALNLDGSGITSISTQIPFFDHMLNSFATHAGFDLTIQAHGDIDVDTHHTIEDTAIVLGQALYEAVGDKKGIRRFGEAFIPMDEALAHGIVDISGRSYCVHTGEPDYLTHSIINGSIVGYPTVMNRHVFDMIASHGNITLHMRLLYGRDPHHITEAQYKALGRALRSAVDRDPTIVGIPSTKGLL